MSDNNFNISGLTTAQVTASRKKHRYNRITEKKQNLIFDTIKSLAKEPMVILLLVASLIYFIAGNGGDGLFLAVAIVLVSTISIYHASQSQNAKKKIV